MKAGEARFTQRKTPLPSLAMRLRPRSLRLRAEYQIPGSNKGSSYISSENGSICPARQRLLEQYNRRFNSWVAQEDAGGRRVDIAESERLALSNLEEAHQKLLQHQQSCVVCKRRKLDE